MQEEKITDLDWGSAFEDSLIFNALSDDVNDNIEIPQAVEVPEYKVVTEKRVELDTYLYKERYWNKTFEVMERKNLDAGKYNELQELKGHWREFVAEIEQGNFDWDIPHKVKIPKGNGKFRVVYVFDIKRRVLLGVLNRILSDYYSERISPNCYSYKEGVTTINAVRDIKSGVYSEKQREYDFGMKLDISKYFNSVSKSRITEMIDTVFVEKDRGLIYELIRVLYSIEYVRDNSSIEKEFLSLIPGIAVSSFFANYCLREIDEYFRTNAIVYARYCDDIILFGKTEEEVNEHTRYIESVLCDYGLSINEDKYTSYVLDKIPVEFLGLKFDKDVIDISESSFKKMKHKIRVACRAARRNVERYHKLPEKEIERVIHMFNYMWYKCYIEDRTKFGWGFYAFRFITTKQTLQQLDYYFRDMLRYIKTGKWNSGNISKMPDERLKALGYVSLTYMYGIFKSDIDVYRDYVACLN